jgi:hypothetical protein
MVTSVPSSLDSATLTRRLGELAGDERNVQVEFLLHLDEFDRRRAYVDAGYGSLWDCCLRALHLRESSAGRRIGAMRVLRRFPKLEPALRDGRLCASTAALLGQVLTDENLEDLVSRAAYQTKAEVEEIVVSLRPRPAPADGVRKLPAQPAGQAVRAVAGGTKEPSPFALSAASTSAPETLQPLMEEPAPVESTDAPTETPARRPEVRPVAEDRWSVRVTLDAEGRAELETLKALLSHKIPNGDLASVLREAIRCGIEKHGKRKGAIAPSRKPRVAREDGTVAKSRNGSADPASPHIPAAVRREVWARDGGRCTFEGPDGHRCDSRWQLELDHITPVALGGSSTSDNLRIRCRPHNMLHAESVFGRDQMEQFRRPALTIAGDSSYSERLTEPASKTRREFAML